MMIQKLFISLLILSSISFSNAAYSEGTNRISKNIKGKIVNGIYADPDNTYQIEVPNWQDMFDYKEMKVKEQFSKTGNYISFGPSATNKNIYRMEYVKKLDPSSYYIELASIKEATFDSYVSQIEQAYKSKAVLISEEIDLFDAKKSYSRVYKQHTPARKKLFKRSQEDLRYHFLDVVDYASYSLLFWVEIPVNLNNSQESESKYFNREVAEYQNFINSFRYTKQRNDLMAGEVIKDTYHSKNDTFSVKVPYLIDPLSASTDEWNYANIDEGNSEEIDYVVFGPAKTDFNRYHVVALNFPMDKNKTNYINNLLKNKITGRGSNFKLMNIDQFQHHSFNSYYAVYENQDAFFVNCIIDKNETFINIEIDIYKNTKNPRVDLDMLIDREFEYFNVLMNSFSELK